MNTTRLWKAHTVISPHRKGTKVSVAAWFSNCQRWNMNLSAIWGYPYRYWAMNLLSAIGHCVEIAKHCTVLGGAESSSTHRMHGENLGASPLNNNLTNGTLMDSTFKCHFLIDLFWLFCKQLRLPGSSILWSKFTVILCYVIFCKSFFFCFMY